MRQSLSSINIKNLKVEKIHEAQNESNKTFNDEIDFLKVLFYQSFALQVLLYLRRFHFHKM